MPTIRFEGYSLSLILLLLLSGGDINEYHVGCVFSGLSVASRLRPQCRTRRQLFEPSYARYRELNG